MRRRKLLINQNIALLTEMSRKYHEASKIEIQIKNQPDFTTPV